VIYLISKIYSKVFFISIVGSMDLGTEDKKNRAFYTSLKPDVSTFNREKTGFY